MGCSEHTTYTPGCGTCGLHSWFESLPEFPNQGAVPKPLIAGGGEHSLRRWSRSTMTDTWLLRYECCELKIPADLIAAISPSGDPPIECPACTLQAGIEQEIAKALASTGPGGFLVPEAMLVPKSQGKSMSLGPFFSGTAKPGMILTTPPRGFAKLEPFQMEFVKKMFGMPSPEPKPQDPGSWQRLHLNQWTGSEQDADDAQEQGLTLSFDTTPMVGWRSWKIVALQTMSGVPALRLASLTGREVWEPMHRVEARCLPRDPMYGYGQVHHEAPWPTCLCGIWATRTLLQLEQEASMGGAHAVGEIEGWGRLLEFRLGWRSQLAYPRSIEIRRVPAELGMKPDEVARELARLYGVEVTLARDVTEVLELDLRQYSLLSIATPRRVSKIEPVTRAQVEAATAYLAAMQAGMIGFKDAMEALGLATKKAGTTLAAVAASRGGRSAAMQALSIGFDPALAEPKQQKRRPVAPRKRSKPLLELRACPLHAPHGPHEHKIAGVKMRCAGVRARR